MAWNPKALKQLGLAPRQHLDAIDMEAEKQGNATRFFQQNDLRPQLGRRISKESRKADGYARTADLRAHTNLVADHAAAHRRLVTPESNLRQR